MTSCLVTRDRDEGRHRGWFHRHDYHRRDRGAVLILTPDNRDNRERYERHERHDNRR